MRQEQGWKPGVAFAVEPLDDGIALRPLNTFPPTATEGVFGCLPYRGDRKSLDDMGEGIRKGARKRA